LDRIRGVTGWQTTVSSIVSETGPDDGLARYCITVTARLTNQMGEYVDIKGDKYELNVRWWADAASHKMRRYRDWEAVIEIFRDVALVGYSPDGSCRREILLCRLFRTQLPVFGCLKGYGKRTARRIQRTIFFMLILTG